jgi:hypothetical protein
MARAAAACAAIASTLAFAGCGGGGHSVSKTSFIAKADVVCNQARLQSAPLAAEVRAAFTQREIRRRPARVVRTLQDLQRTGADVHSQLAAIKPPKPDRRIWSSYLRAYEAVNTELALAAKALQGHRLLAFSKALADERVYSAEAAGIALGYGFHACAQSQ